MIRRLFSDYFRGQGERRGVVCGGRFVLGLAEDIALPAHIKISVYVKICEGYK